MLNRLSVSALLKIVIAITSICVVIALSLTAWESWDRLRTASRISQITDASADLFKAMHNLRTDRSTTSRLLNATEPMDPEIEKYLRALRDAQMPAMARALELLPNIDFPRSGTLVPELARLNKLLIEEQKEFWENVAKSKEQRRAGLTKEYMETTQGLLDVLDNLSNTLAATVNQAVYTGPGRVGLRVDIQFQHVARRAPSGASLVGRAVGHLDGDFMVVGVKVFFHGTSHSGKATIYVKPSRGSRG